MNLKMFTVPEVAEILRLDVKTLYCPVHRSRIGLPFCRIGGKLLVKETELLRVIAENTETLPPWTGPKKPGRKGKTDAAED